ncbi:MAG TPA: threonine/serine dehydratase [Bacillota bacterium]
MISLDQIKQARERIAPHVYRTPLIRSTFLSDLCGADVRLKLECQQILNAFKVRGMINRVLTMSDEDRRRGIVVASSGNHGIAASYCGHRWGIEVEVYAPRTTPATKVERIRRLGAALNLEGRDYDDAYQRAKARAEETGKVYVDSSSDPVAVAGHGSIAYEILEDFPDLDTMVVPFGGGGLATSVGTVIRDARPRARIYGLQSQASPALTASLRDNVCYEAYPSDPSICEGLIGGIGAIGFAHARQVLDVTEDVNEETVRAAIVRLVMEDKVIAEGSGAVGAAYLMDHPEEFRDRRVAVIISGGNLDFSVLAEEIRRRSGLGEAKPAS